MQQMNRHRGRGDKAMNAFNWHNSAMWTALSLLFLLLALMVGPAPVLADGRGTVGGTFAVVVQDNNKADSPEFVVMTGSFGGSADLSLPFAGKAPIGFISDGQGVVDQTGQTFTFSGKFRLPYALDPQGTHAKPRWHQSAYYLSDDYRTPVAVEGGERSLGWPTVRLEIKF